MADLPLEVIGRVETFDPHALDLIMWSLRLPLLREERSLQHHGRTPERDRLDALITEGERALGILPPEDAS